jgi:predicted amidohydrolase
MDVVGVPFPVSWEVDRNLSYIEAALQSSHPGELLAFPEGALSGYGDDLSPLARVKEAGLVRALDHVHRLAIGQEVAVALGTLWPGAAGWTNSAVYLAPDGGRRWYHKVNLAYHERGILAFGQALPVLNTPQGRLGLQLCRDLRFPEQWRWLALQGAELVVYLTHAIGDQNAYPVWRSHLVSRAAENQRFVLAVNTASDDQMCPSVIVDPRGRVLVESRGADAPVMRASLDLSQVSDWYLSQSRTDLLRLEGPPVA